MKHTNTAVQVAGTWLAVASLLLIVTLLAHGPIAVDPGEQMTRIAEASLRWSVVHWIAAAALSFHALAALVMLSSGSRLTESRWTMTAWAAIPIGALWTVTTAVVEATVVADAALAGDAPTFQAWWAFAEGKATGFAVLAAAVAVIAGHEARHSAGWTPAWAAWIGAAAGLASVAGWALGVWFGVGFGSLLWVAASSVMSLWTLWFGLAVTRDRPE